MKEQLFTEIFPNEYLEENRFIRGKSRIDDVRGDVANSLREITEAFEMLLRPELKERLENIYTERYINDIKNFIEAAKEI